MGSGRTNLLLRHDKIREGRQEELAGKITRTLAQAHKDDGSDWEGFPLGFLSSRFSFFLSRLFSRSL